MKKENYIEPTEFFDEMLDCMQKEKVSHKMAKIIMMLSERRINHRMFVRYVHIREDLISIGIEACLKGFMKFRPMRNILIYSEETQELIDKIPVLWDGKKMQYDYTIHNNPYSFFSKVIENACLQYLKREYNQRNIVNKIKLENGINPDFGYLDSESNHSFDENETLFNNLEFDDQHDESKVDSDDIVYDNLEEREDIDENTANRGHTFRGEGEQ